MKFKIASDKPKTKQSNLFTLKKIWDGSIKKLGNN